MTERQRKLTRDSQHSRRRVFFILLIFLAAVAACSDPPPPTATLSPEEALGDAVFVTNCAPCHATAPEAVIVGPSLAGIATTAATRVEGMDAREYLEVSIMFPKDYVVEGFDGELMPTTFGVNLTGEEMDALVAYLLTLK